MVKIGVHLHKLSQNSNRYHFLDHPVYALQHNIVAHIYSVSQKKSPLRGPDVSHFSHKRLRIFNLFFTHLLHIPIYARRQSYAILSTTTQFT